jgi:GNAT superfamily N-acetyltransferase
MVLLFMALSIYTDQLWVDKAYRGQGFAKKIMDKVHEFGKLEACKIATVQMMGSIFL